MAIEPTQETKTDQFNSIIDFYKVGALYSVLTLVWDTLTEGYQLLNALYDPKFTIDAYCPMCGDSSTFSHVQTITPPNAQVMRREPMGILVTMRCARSGDHLRHYAFEQRQNVVTKIGEFPSAYETSQAQVNSYKKILTTAQLSDLKLALAGYAHGIGAGALIYLRRLFESLVEEAHQEAKTDSSWNESDYAGARMADKIRLLARWLPDYLVANRQIYSVMSAGIHSLTEEQCKAMFPVVQAGVILILEQHLAAKRRADLAKETSANLKTLQSLIESGSLPGGD